MKLTFYAIGSDHEPPRPASAQRQWMDDTIQSFAYRCLPLNIANSHGWEFPCPADFSARWLGGENSTNVDIRSAAPPALQPVSIFGHGVLTFHLHGIFRTEPGWNMFATGPTNSPKDGIYALSGIIETDWAPYTFTMNWKFTRANTWVSFEKGEPICLVFPVQRGVLDQSTPEIRSISDDPKLEADYRAWSASRSRFNDYLQVTGSDEQEQGWQKRYYRGLDMHGQVGARDHQAKLRLPEFIDLRKSETPATAVASKPVLPAFFRDLTTLSRTKHATMGLKEGDFSFAASDHLIPLTAVELVPASRNYPIVFSMNNPPRPMAVVGLRPGINMFVDNKGAWRPGCHVPAAVRRYPFVTIVNRDKPGAFTAGIDPTAPILDPSWPKKLFESNGEMTPFCRERLEFTAICAAAFEKTEEFVAAIPHETLLMPCRNVAHPRAATRSGMTGLRVVDPERLAALPAQTRSLWQSKGWLAALEAQVASARNWTQLLEMEDASLQPAT